MAVELKISVQENCDSIYVFDQTGKYDKECNTTGWGYPNPYKSCDATSAEIHVYPPGEETPIVIDVYPDFPVEGGCGVEILPADLGLEKFVSGTWRFDYQVRAGDDNELLFVSCQKLFVKDIQCCIEGKEIKVTVDNFESKEVIKSNNMKALFESAKDSACIGDLAASNKIIDFLYVKCKCPC